MQGFSDGPMVRIPLQYKGHRFHLVWEKIPHAEELLSPGDANYWSPPIATIEALRPRILLPQLEETTAMKPAHCN